MRVFVCEFVTGGGLVAENLPAGLSREGDMMLQALVKDLAEIPDVDVTFTRDRRLPVPDLPGAILWAETGDDPWRLWRETIAGADALWPIAPETDGILERLSALALTCRRTLLGCVPDAVGLTTSKRRTAEHLAMHGVSAAAALPLVDALADGLPASATGWVVKPDDGTGAEDTMLFRDPAALARWAEAASDPGRFVIQPYLPGRATSLSLLCSKGRAALLSCNLQDVRLAGDRFHYRGGIVGGAEDQRELYAPIANVIAAATPGLWGHVGIDLIDSAAGPVVLEINPRLTTSYAGLSAALGSNPAALVLQLLTRDLADIALPQRPRRQVVEVAEHAA